MNKWEVQQAYWSSFGLVAYNEETVPENAVLPYITYQPASGSLNGQVTVSGSLWYRGTSWAPIMQKTTEMEPMIDRQLKVDGGYVKFRKPVSNFAQPMSDPNDDRIRRMVLSVEVEFLTE